MIIEKIVIENYQCYYGKKEFDFSPGFNIILGENGEGKTKFFEAFDWLLNGDDRNLDELVSAKKIIESNEGESFNVSVSLHVNKPDFDGILTKSFLVKKYNAGINISNYQIEGVEKNKAGEREIVDGENLLERIFPTTIRKYSLFKGEAQLDIFKNEDALSLLINSFSSAKYFEKYAVKGQFLKDSAESAVALASKTDKKNEEKYKGLDASIKLKQHKKNNIEEQINIIEDQRNKAQDEINNAEKLVENAENLDILKKRIGDIESKISKISKIIDEDYTTNLFDEKWILMNFASIHEEFTKKISSVAKLKRKLQTDFDKEIWIKKGKEEIRNELLNNLIPLPIGTPTKAHMDEMIKEEWCKVCNRSAKKGSPEYNFMVNRLLEYLKSQEPVQVEPEPESILFPNNYIDRLINLNTNHEDNLANLKNVKNVISEHFENNEGFKKELALLNSKLKKEVDEKNRLVGNSQVGEESLSLILRNYNGNQDDLLGYNEKLSKLSIEREILNSEISELNSQKDGIDKKTVSTFLLNTQSVLRDIAKVFTDTKESKFNEFILLLEDKSNIYFREINIEAFTGKIAFVQTGTFQKPKISVELQVNGKAFRHGSESLKTSMHISILYAISELAASSLEECYPLIFDAPTSSFGETKATQFLNLLYDVSGQKILLIKDFLRFDDNNNLFIIPEFQKINRHKAFLVKLNRPFDKESLATLNTEIINL